MAESLAPPGAPLSRAHSLNTEPRSPMVQRRYARSEVQRDHLGWSSFTLFDCARVGDCDAPPFPISGASSSGPESESERAERVKRLSPIQCHGWLAMYVEYEDGPPFGRTNPVRTWRDGYMILLKSGKLLWLRPPSCIWRGATLANVEIEPVMHTNGLVFKLETARRTMHFRCRTPADANAWMTAIAECSERQTENGMIETAEFMLTDRLDNSFEAPLALLELSKRERAGGLSPVSGGPSGLPVMLMRGRHDPNKFVLPSDTAVRRAVRDLRMDSLVFPRAPVRGDGGDDGRYALLDATYGAFVARMLSSRAAMLRHVSFVSTAGTEAPGRPRFASAASGSTPSTPVISPRDASRSTGWSRTVGTRTGFPDAPSTARGSIADDDVCVQPQVLPQSSARSGTPAGPGTFASSVDVPAAAKRLLGYHQPWWESHASVAHIASTFRAAQAAPAATSTEDTFADDAVNALLIEAAAIAGAPPEYIVRAVELAHVQCLGAANALYYLARGRPSRGRRAVSGRLSASRMHRHTSSAASVSAAAVAGASRIIGAPVAEPALLMLHGVEVGAAAIAIQAQPALKYKAKAAPVYRSAKSRFVSRTAQSTSASTPTLLNDTLSTVSGPLASTLPPSAEQSIYAGTFTTATASPPVAMSMAAFLDASAASVSSGGDGSVQLPASAVAPSPSARGSAMAMTQSMRVPKDRPRRGGGDSAPQMSTSVSFSLSSLFGFNRGPIPAHVADEYRAPSGAGPPRRDSRLSDRAGEDDGDIDDYVVVADPLSDLHSPTSSPLRASSRPLSMSNSSAAFSPPGVAGQSPHVSPGSPADVTRTAATPPVSGVKRAMTLRYGGRSVAASSAARSRASTGLDADTTADSSTLQILQHQRRTSATLVAEPHIAMEHE